jgi:hypothetical protein
MKTTIDMWRAMSAQDKAAWRADGAQGIKVQNKK